MPSTLKTRELVSYRLSPRVVLRRGDRVKLTGGTTYDGHSIGLHGVFELLKVLRKGKRVWLECRAVTKEGLAGTYTVFVEGRSFRRRDLPGVVMRPYRVRRVRKRPPREKQLMLFSMPERSAGN